jgi:hypothetical protein
VISAWEVSKRVHQYYYLNLRHWHREIQTQVNLAIYTFITHIFAYPQFYFIVLRSISVLYAAMAEAAAHGQ